MPFLERARIRFTLRHLPAATPRDAAFFVQSNLNSHAPAHPGWRLERAGEGWALEREIPLGTLLEVRVTRGTLESEAGSVYGRRSPMQRHVVRAGAEIELEVAGWRDLGSGKPPHTLSGHIEAFTLESPEFEQALETLVYLPPSYKGGVGRYPVLYLHDGNNVFDAATAYADVEWGADEAAEKLALEGKEAILVAVPVRGEHRSTDYTPFSSRFNGFAPGADRYLAFLADTLKPAIDAKFRTLEGPGYTGVCGSSFGGIVSLYCALERPDVYGFCGALSPSQWLGDFELREWLETKTARGQHFLVSMGEYEGGTLEEADFHVRLARELADALEEKGAQVRFAFGEGGWHDEAAWAALFPGVLRFFLERA